MTRNTEPQLTAPDSMEEPERASLALFLAMLRQHASETAAIINSYDSPQSLLLVASETATDETLNSRILQVTGPIFEAEIDLEVDVDTETGAAMRRNIERAIRSGADMDRRRIVRMATFAGEVATWGEEHDMMSHVDDAGPSAVSQGLHAITGLSVNFLEPGLPETA